MLSQLFDWQRFIYHNDLLKHMRKNRSTFTKVRRSTPSDNSPAMGGLQIPRWLGLDPLSSWWLGLAPATLGFWVRFPNERNQGKQANPVLKYRVPHGSQVCDGQTSPHKPRLVVPHSTCLSLSPSPPAHSFIIGPAVINTHIR